MNDVLRYHILPWRTAIIEYDKRNNIEYCYKYLNRIYDYVWFFKNSKYAKFNHSIIYNYNEDKWNSINYEETYDFKTDKYIPRKEKIQKMDHYYEWTKNFLDCFHKKYNDGKGKLIIIAYTKSNPHFLCFKRAKAFNKVYFNKLFCKIEFLKPKNL
jgi:hypothetical protein